MFKLLLLLPNEKPVSFLITHPVTRYYCAIILILIQKSISHYLGYTRFLPFSPPARPALQVLLVWKPYFIPHKKPLSNASNSIIVITWQGLPAYANTHTFNHKHARQKTREPSGRGRGGTIYIAPGTKKLWPTSPFSSSVSFSPVDRPPAHAAFLLCLESEQRKRGLISKQKENTYF